MKKPQPPYVGTTGSRMSQSKRIISVGDLHGDLEAFKTILTQTNLAKFDGKKENGRENVKWVGGNTVLASTGDSVDRGEFGLQIYNIFEDLSNQAVEDGGFV